MSYSDKISKFSADMTPFFLLIIASGLSRSDSRGGKILSKPESGISTLNVKKKIMKLTRVAVKYFNSLTRIRESFLS
jgi:hypothetical protein